MTSGMFDSTTIPILQEVIQFAQTRHGLLAGNVANLDTPGYRVRDLSLSTFQQRLKEAIEARNETHESMSPGMLTDPADDKLREVRDSIKSILYHDKSDVGMEQQVNEINKNQMMHNLAITIMRHQFGMLQTAVAERV